MKTILFASDLDQTLIYSYRMITNEIEKQLLAVEWLNDRYISYMTQNAFRKLKEISQKILFVPVTTRTKLQYQRINFLGSKDLIQYAVTSNGGTIFCRGIEDEEWTNHVLKGIADCADSQDVINKFNELSDPSWVIEDSGKLADNLFYYCLIERGKIPLAEIADFKTWVKENNWELSVQGRKLYLVPRNVNKRSAILYIKQKEGMSRLLAAGDSILDFDLLHSADLGIAPAHGELYAQYLQGISGLEKIRFTQMSGIAAAEEILNIVMESLCEKSVG